MGEAMEEFFRIAEEINRSLVDEGGRHGCVARPSTHNITAGPAADTHTHEQPDNSPGGLLTRWFGRHRERGTRAPGTPQADDEELWQQYKSKFEEV